MPRVVKTAEDRRAELLDLAEELFFEIGYERTTVADIIARAGVSKGGFYHHFDSKEALLEALLARISAQIVSDAEAAYNTPGLNALDKFNAFLRRSRDWKRNAAPRLRSIFTAILAQGNERLYQRLVRNTVALLMPMLTKIVDEGTRAGDFAAPHPGLVAEIVLNLGMTRQESVAAAIEDAQRGNVEAAAEKLHRRIMAEGRVLDRLLGVPEGSIVLDEPGFARVMLEAMVPAAAEAESAA
jgi:AcrR family transcriptional regulator